MYMCYLQSRQLVQLQIYKKHKNSFEFKKKKLFLLFLLYHLLFHYLVLIHIISV